MKAIDSFMEILSGFINNNLLLFFKSIVAITAIKNSNNILFIHHFCHLFQSNYLFLIKQRGSYV